MAVGFRLRVQSLGNRLLQKGGVPLGAALGLWGYVRSRPRFSVFSPQTRL